MIISPSGPQPPTGETLAERLSAALDIDIDIGPSGVRAATTIGVSIFPQDGNDASTLIANADAALFRAKTEKRGSIHFFEPAMDRELREKRALQQELRMAIARDELALHYQPYRKIGGETIGFEALVRWHRGLVLPTQFIPIAEESGLIVPMGGWILRAACSEAASWPQPLRISVNLSPVQFREGDLPAPVHSILLETGLAPRRLKLEITEGVLIDDFARALSILRRLKNLGVRIAMTTSAAAIRRCPICRRSRSTRSRSTSRSSPTYRIISSLPLSCARLWAWRTAWGCRCWRKAWKPSSSTSFSPAKIATRCRASGSDRRNPSANMRRLSGAGVRPDEKWRSYDERVSGGRRFRDGLL